MPATYKFANTSLRHVVVTLAFLAVMLTFSLTVGCCSPSLLSSSIVGIPSAVADGNGGAFVIYEAWEDVPRVQRFDADGRPVWANKGYALVKQGGLLPVVRQAGFIVPDGQGGVFVFWRGGSGFELRGQQLTAQGRPLWSPEGVQVSPPGVQGVRVFSNGEGGCVIGFMDGRDVYVQKLDGQGKSLWPTGPRVSCERYDLVGDGAGGVIVFWNVRESAPGRSQAYAQRIARNGADSWPGGKVNLGDLYIGEFSSVAADGAGGAFLTDSATVLRLSNDGREVWRTQVYDRVAMDKAGEFTLSGRSILASATGGVFIIWAGNRSIFTQIVSSDGHTIFPATGARIWRSDKPFSANVYLAGVSDGKGGVIAVWQCWPGDRDGSLMAMGLDSQGNRLRGEQPLTIAATSWGQILPPFASPDGIGGAIVCWVCDVKSIIKFASEGYIQRIDAHGRPLWGIDGIKLT